MISERRCNEQKNQYRKFHLNTRKYFFFFTQKCSSTVTGCPKGPWSLRVWRCMISDWTWSWALCVKDAALIRVFDLDLLHRYPQPLPYCDSVMYVLSIVRLLCRTTISPTWRRISINGAQVMQYNIILNCNIHYIRVSLSILKYYRYAIILCGFFYLFML